MKSRLVAKGENLFHDGLGGIDFPLHACALLWGLSRTAGVFETKGTAETVGLEKPDGQQRQEKG